MYALDQQFASSESADPVKLFFAAFPDPATAVRIAQIARDLQRRYRLRGEPLLTSRFHCTLFGFDDVESASPMVEAKAREAAAMVRARSFRVSFDSAMSFSRKDGSYITILVGEDGVIGLRRLGSSLYRAMREVGLRPRDGPVLTPHVTLMYGCRFIGECPIEPIGWTVDEFVLVRSLVRKTTHIPLERWPLGG